MASPIVFCVFANALYVTEAEGYSYTAIGGIEKLRKSYTEVEPSNRIDIKQMDGGVIEGESHEMTLTGTYKIKEESDRTPNKELREMETEESEAIKRNTIQVKSGKSPKTSLSKSIQSEKKIHNSRIGRKTCAVRCKSLRNSNDKDLHRNELVDAWSKQLGVVERIIDHMENVQRQRKSEFEDLLEEMETKTTTEKQMTSVETTTEAIPTFLTIIDETEVRTALKRDPLVRRILEMARMKREEFFRGLKENNITLS